MVHCLCNEACTWPNAHAYMRAQVALAQCHVFRDPSSPPQLRKAPTKLLAVLIAGSCSIDRPRTHFLVSLTFGPDPFETEGSQNGQRGDVGMRGDTARAACLVELLKPELSVALPPCRQCGHTHVGIDWTSWDARQCVPTANNNKAACVRNGSVCRISVVTVDERICG